MSYKEMCQEFNRRRKEELSLCSQTIRTAVDLYAKILETNRIYCQDELASDRSASNELCVSLEKLYEALTDVDSEIEKIALEPSIQSTIIYHLGTHGATVVLHPHKKDE